MAEDYAFQAFMRAYYAIKSYKEKYNDGITIILGAGCSLTSTSQDITTESIITKCLQDNYDCNYTKPDSWERLYQDFIDKLWSHKGEQEKVDMLSLYLGYLRPSKGYQALQRLIEAGFVSNIITTNFDIKNLKGGFSMNRKWWKLVFLLPICLCLLYVGGYAAQFIRNYQTWSSAGNFAGNGTYPQAPSIHPKACFLALTVFPYNLYGTAICVLFFALLILLLMRMGWHFRLYDAG